MNPLLIALKKIISDNVLAIDSFNQLLQENEILIKTHFVEHFNKIYRENIMHVWTRNFSEIGNVFITQLMDCICKSLRDNNNTKDSLPFPKWSLEDTCLTSKYARKTNKSPQFWKTCTESVDFELSEEPSSWSEQEQDVEFKESEEENICLKEVEDSVEFNCLSMCQ